MKLPTYTSTPGLDRYPVDERFAVYRATHKRLMREDVRYRKHWNSYVIGIASAVIAPAGCYIGGGPYGIALSILLPMFVAAAVIFLALRQQKFMNERIGDALRR